MNGQMGLELAVSTVVAVCDWCGGENTFGVCPKSVACPKCEAQPGQSCKRPSGHRAMTLHSARVELAESM